MTSHKTETGVYGPGSFTDTEYSPLPVECARILRHIAGVTPGFTKDESLLDGVQFTGSDMPNIPGPLKSQALAAVLIAMTGIVSKEISEIRGTSAGTVAVDVDKAGLFLATAALVTVDGKNMAALNDHIHNTGADLDRFVLSENDMRYRTWAIYPTKDPKVWYQILSSFDPAGLLKIFGLDVNTQTSSRQEAYDIISAVTRKYSAAELELKCMENGYCGQTCYTPAQWRETNMGKSLARHPLINVQRTKDSADLPPVPFPSSKDLRPLSGIKVVELTRVIAGPAMAAYLTSLGAEVIKVQSPDLHDIQGLSVQLTADKTTTSLDLTKEDDRSKLHALIESADVVLQAFRLRSLERKGFGLDDILETARRRGKGIVYLDLNCYGPDGYYAERPGFQQIADAASGCSYVCGNAYGFPEGTAVLPCLPIADMLSGVVGVVDVLLALRDRALHGGSYHATAALTSLDTMQLSPEVGLLPRSVVEQIQQKYQFGPMTPDLHVEELLYVILAGWGKNSDLLSRPGYMTHFPETPFGKDHCILGPVLKLGNEQVTPRWLRGPVPYCWTPYEHVSWQKEG